MLIPGVIRITFRPGTRWQAVCRLLDQHGLRLKEVIKQRRAPAGTRRQTTIDVHVQTGQERALMAKLGGSPIVAVVGAAVEAAPVKLKPVPAKESRALMRLQRSSVRGLRGKGICR